MKLSEMGTTGLVDYVADACATRIEVKQRFGTGFRSLYRVRMAIALRLVKRRHRAEHHEEIERRFRDAVKATLNARMAAAKLRNFEAFAQ